jgi:hypothetical protein
MQGGQGSHPEEVNMAKPLLRAIRLIVPVIVIALIACAALPQPNPAAVNNAVLENNPGLENAALDQQSASSDDDPAGEDRAEGRKKFIEVGLDAPSPEFVRTHLRTMEEKPFDGVVMSASVAKNPIVFRTRAYPDSAFLKDRINLAGIHSHKLSDNWLMMWASTEDDFDWFSEAHWAATEKNLRNFGRLVRAGHLKGIFFDTELYSGDIWDYSKQPHNDTRSFDAYRAQLRRRGAQFVNILQSEAPGLQVYFMLGMMSAQELITEDKSGKFIANPDLEHYFYGLYPAFLNGALDATRRKASLTDGNESTYYCFTAKCFDLIRQLIRQVGPDLIEPALRPRYDARVKVGAAVFTDLMLDLFDPAPDSDWSGQTPAHFMTPAERLKLLEHSTYNALRISDRYAWLWTEQFDWWKNLRVPTGAAQTILRAKGKIAHSEPLGFSVDGFVQRAVGDCQKANADKGGCKHLIPLSAGPY